jgi:hypothetical protein
MPMVRYHGTHVTGRERSVPGHDADSGSLATDAFFATLDGCWIMRGHRRWEIEIFSVSVQESWRWIQLRLVGEPTFVLTLRERVDTSPSDVYTVLAARVALLVSDRSSPPFSLRPQEGQSAASAPTVS